MTIQEIINKYAVTTTPADAGKGETAPFPQVPSEMGNHRCRFFIDGHDYFFRLNEEIKALSTSTASNRFLYISGWWHELVTISKPRLEVKGPPVGTNRNNLWRTAFNSQAISTPGLPNTLVENLIKIHKQGVEIRMLGWVSPFIDYERVANKLAHFKHINFSTIFSTDHLRTETGLDDHFMLNTCAHALGGVHAKFIIAGEDDKARAYTSGLDLQHLRLNKVNPLTQQRVYSWHDASVMVEGIAAGYICNFFTDLWNEQLKQPVKTFTFDGKAIPSHDPSWPRMVGKGPFKLPAGSGKQHVQILRTLPQMNFNASSTRRGTVISPDSNAATKAFIGLIAGKTIYKRKKLEVAPDGKFEFKVALQKAIAAADRYIFIADQGLYCHELMDWLRDAMLAKPRLKVILLNTGPDPNGFFAEGVKNHLTSPNLPKNLKGEPRQIAFYKWTGVSVHCKVVLIDDRYCIVGSANAMRRSFYTDIELSSLVMEEETPREMLPTSRAEALNPGAAGKQAPSAIQQFRWALWLHYCGFNVNLPNTKDDVMLHKSYDIKRAMKIWDKTWKAGKKAIPGLTPIPAIQRLFPLIPSQPYTFKQAVYDREDPDSRQKF
ncbi:MAG: phospholipase D-like domain-containing protein [Bacteroidia bacterium]